MLRIESRLCGMMYECDAPIQKAEIESNLRTDEVVARRVDGMWARTEVKIGELRMQLEHGLRAIVGQQVRSASLDRITIMALRLRLRKFIVP